MKEPVSVMDIKVLTTNIISNTIQYANEIISKGAED